MALLSAYNFSEGSGSTTADVTGNGHDLTTDGTGWVAGGHTGYGGKNVFTSPHIGPNQSFSSWTVMAWVKFSAVPNYWGLILGNRGDFWLQLHGNGSYVVVNCWTGLGGEPESAAVDPDTWYHVAIVNNNGVGQFYINGVSSGAPGASGQINFDAGGGNFEVGSGGVNDGFNLDGVVDDLRVFSGALTVPEITAFMNTPVVATPATLLAAYAFNEADGATTTADHSGNNITATISGATFTDGALPNTRAITFTGTGQSVVIPRAGTEPASVGLTAMLWAKGPVDMDYLVKSKDGGGSTRSGVGPNWRFRWKDDLRFTDGGSGVDTNNWHHYCVVDTDNRWAIYIDGVAYDGALRTLDTSTAPPWEDYPWTIGLTPNGSLGDSRAGQMVSDVRIFQGDMTQAEVQLWMNTPVMPQGRRMRLGTSGKPLKLGSTEKFINL